MPFLLMLALSLAPADLRFHDGAVEATGVDEPLLKEIAADPSSCGRVLAVFTDREAPGRPAVAGTCRVDQGLLRFVPRYPFMQGTRYVARLGRGEDARRLAFRIPEPDLAPTTAVTAILPSADELPMNLLRIYVHFSAPMTRGRAYQHVRLLDWEGREVRDAFLRMTPELWDPRTRRLTLLFDPGRIKRGLEPHEQFGLPLQMGRSYRLLIDPSWEDSRGVPLARGGEKRFTVAAPDRTSPQPSRWEISPPPGGSRAPLQVRFPDPLDSALLRRLIRVRAPGGEFIRGRVELADNESAWLFHPARPWSPGRHTLVVGAWLEDLAGNNLNRPFDYDLESRQQAHTQREHHLSFEIEQ